MCDGPFTDRKLLKTIYDMYRGDYYAGICRYETDAGYAIISCGIIAQKMGCSKDEIYRRLQYRLNKKYAYPKNNENPKGRIFFIAWEEKLCFPRLEKMGLTHVDSNDKYDRYDVDLIHFPTLEGALADENHKHYAFILPIVLSAIAIAVSVFHALIDLFKN